MEQGPHHDHLLRSLAATSPTSSTSDALGARQQQQQQWMNPAVQNVVPIPSAPAMGSKLTSTQKGELELARQRADRASAAARSRRPAVPLQQQTYHGKGGIPTKRPLSITSAEGLDSDDECSSQNTSPHEGDDKGGSEEEKDARKLQRLLRNRVSAQQARERKKAYVGTLEERLAAQKEQLAEVESKLAAAEESNATLRRIILSMRATSQPANMPASGQQPAMLTLGPRASATGGNHG